MSILDKHPAPWTRCELGSIVDSNGHLVLDEMSPSLGHSDDDAAALERLELAAPELLAAVQKVAACGSSGDAETDAAIVECIGLIARIEGAK